MAANRERTIEVFNTKILAGTVEDGLSFRRNPTGSTVFSISSGGIFTMADTGNIAVGTTTGTKIGTATSQKLGFWNTTPIVQPVGATQGTLQSYSTGGFGLDTDVKMQALFDLVIAIRLALVNAGLMKGGA